MGKILSAPFPEMLLHLILILFYDRRRTEIHLQDIFFFSFFFADIDRQDSTEKYIYALTMGY